tara:strand:+ start:57 stop:494 length:438 start_codon:yes stop_codon:yes gene_type:complete
MSIDKKTLLGNAGEKIVANYLQEKGFKVEHSVDPYDNQKDMKVNGKTLEVKTQVPFVFKNSFTIKDNHQLKKCENADYLIFVQAPCAKLDESGIFQVDKGWTYERYTTKAGVKMIMVSMKQTAVRKLTSIEGKNKKILRNYATPF